MKIELDVSANKNCDDIFLQIFCDDQKIAHLQARSDTYSLVHDISDAPAQHSLKLVLSGKNRTHTLIDKQGNILDDVYFQISRLEFEELDVKEIFCLGHACYTHNFNSPGTEFVDEFYGHIGCNGIVDLQFSTPIFLWLNQYDF